MNRRNVLLGLGAAAAGSGAIFGSGAFTQIDAERSIDIAVDGDSSALLELDASTATPVVDQDGTGGSGLSLDINTDDIAESQQGLNANARIDIGSTTGSNSLTSDLSSFFSDDFDANVGPAFTIDSNTVTGEPIDVLFDMSNVSAGGQDLFLVIEKTVSTEEIATASNDTGATGSPDDQLLIKDLDSGDAASAPLDAAFVVKTNTTADTTDLSGNIVVTAEQAGNDSGVTDETAKTSATINMNS